MSYMVGIRKVRECSCRRSLPPHLTCQSNASKKSPAAPSANPCTCSIRKSLLSCTCFRVLLCTNLSPLIAYPTSPSCPPCRSSPVTLGSRQIWQPTLRRSIEPFYDGCNPACFCNKPLSLPRARCLLQDPHPQEPPHYACR